MMKLSLQRIELRQKLNKSESNTEILMTLAKEVVWMDIIWLDVHI